MFLHTTSHFFVNQLCENIAREDIHANFFSKNFNSSKYVEDASQIEESSKTPLPF
jgi:hypothetical protein